MTFSAAVAVSMSTACGSGSTATGPTGDGGTPISCTASQQVCGSSCADTQHDPSNCGGCGKACTGSEVCSSGKCASSCGTGSTQCTQSCVDTTSDNANCGACGTVCSAGESCSNGSCTATCGAGAKMCSSACVDTNVDPKNCGSCGTLCSAGQDCVGGSCASVCGTGMYCAGAEGGAGSCADTNTDNANCGACGTTCTGGQECANGKCAAPLLTCGDSGASTLCKPDGHASYCADTTTDNANCGTCGVACTTGTVCAAGKCGNDCASVDGGTETLCKPDAGAAYCTDTQTDNANCGTCGLTCGAGTVCSAGKCANGCASVDGGTETLCKPNGSAPYCTDTQTDNANCGGCGTACGATATCTRGACVPTCTNILYISTASTAPAGVIAGLQAKLPTACMINYYNANSATPTLAALNEYNVILASNEDGVPYTDPTGLGNVLATYFNGGGQVVIALFADGGYGVTGTFASSYLLITPVNVPDNADSWSSTAATQDIVPTSPVLANMHSITGTGWHGTQVVEHGGVAVAEWASGDLLAVTGVVTDGNGHMRNRVDLNILPSDVGAAAWTGDAFQLLANAIMYR